jgi:hypothetical protein
MCEMAQQGQLVVKSPTTFGNGPASSGTLTVTKRA